MVGADVTVVCRACERKVKMDQIKFDDVRTAYVCESCFASTHKVSNETKNPLVDDALRSVDSLKRDLIKYTCRRCKYHFARQKGKEISVCPYCGSNNLDLLSKDASKLISDSNFL